MARNSTTTTATTSSKPSRKFSVNTASIPDSAPTIADGIYLGHLKNVKADAEDKQFAKWEEVEGLQLFDVIEKITGKRDAREHTGEYFLRGGITYSVELANEAGVQDLPMDTMTIFGGRVNIIFTKDEEGNWTLDNSANDFGVVNRTWKGFVKAAGLTDEDLEEIFEATPFDEDAEIEIPERLQDVPDALEMLQACLFYKTFFSLVAERVAGTAVKANISRRARSKDSDELVNEINTGSFNSSCGLLPVE